MTKIVNSMPQLTPQRQQRRINLAQARVRQKQKLHDKSPDGLYLAAEFTSVTKTASV